jgi:hypothetical protein
MKISKLGLSFILICTFAAASFAEPLCTPGEVSTPPCTAQSVISSTNPDETPMPPASDTVDLIGLAEDVAWSLLLF